MLLQNFPGVDPHFFGRANFLNILYILVGNDLLKVSNKDTGTLSLPYTFYTMSATLP